MPTIAGIAGVTIVKSRAERSTDKQSDIIVHAMVVVVRRAPGSLDREGAGAGVALSRLLPVASVRELDVEEILACPRALDIVREKVRGDITTTNRDQGRRGMQMEERTSYKEGLHPRSCHLTRLCLQWEQPYYHVYFDLK